MVKSKDSAEKIANAMKIGNSSLETSVKSNRFSGIVRFVPEEFEVSDVTNLIPTCEKAEQFGKSRTFRLYFPSKDALEASMKDPPKIGFERLRVDEFHFLPRRCYKCHLIGHIAANCPNAEICSQCASNYRKSTKEQPCMLKERCVVCKVSGHSCYSVSCPENRKSISEQNRSHSLE